MYWDRKLSSVYALEYEGDVYLDFLPLPRHYDMTSFSASLVNLGTGEVVVSGNFIGDQPMDLICNEFINLMVSQLQE